MEPYLTTKQAAELLQVSERTVRSWVADKKIPAVKVGHTLRIPEKQFTLFLENATQQVQTDPAHGANGTNAADDPAAGGKEKRTE